VKPLRDPDLECLQGVSRKLNAVSKVMAAGVIGLGFIAAVGFHLWRERVPSTAQARVERDSFPVSSRLEGMIGKSFVSNGQYVRAGDLLVEMDKRDGEARLARAAAEVDQAQTAMQGIARRLSKTQPELEKAVSTLRHRERELDTVMLDYEAVSGLRAKKPVSPGRWWTVRKAYQEALSRYSEAKGALGGAIDRVQGDQALGEATAAKLRTAQATIQRTELQLSSARIYATVEGRVAFDKSKLAQRLPAGEGFLSLEGEPWVVADFTRSQLKRLKPGQRVRIRIGAIKQRTFQGNVASIGPLASGALTDRMPVPRVMADLFHLLPTASAKIAFDADSVRGFEERMDSGLSSSVEVVPK
jgi:membrane fusion protein (multidrug efflux system)